MPRTKTEEEILAELTEKPKKKQKRVRTSLPEHDVCVLIHEWIQRQGHPFMYIRVPNEGSRTPRFMQMLKMEGWRGGVSDYIFFDPMGKYHGLILEVKRLDGHKPSGTQIDFLVRAANRGYASVCAYGHKASIEVISQYYFNNGEVDYEIPKTINFNKRYCQ